jgi:hypothetical protein
MQKAIIVTKEQSDPNLQELNFLIGEEGWKVVNTCPMPSSCSTAGDGNAHVSKVSPTCLVIIEKDK